VFEVINFKQRQYYQQNQNKKMKVTAEKNEQVANMIFGSIYPHYWKRLEKHGRTKEEFHKVIEWLTGHDEKKIQAFIKDKSTFREFFEKAKMHPNAHMIKGVVCGSD